MFPAPTRVDFSADEYDLLHIYMKNKIEYIKAKSQGLREDLLPRWVRNYKGIPAEDEKTTPWPGAANLVVQLIGTHCDELLSRVMAIYMYDPLFAVKLLGDFKDGEFTGDDQKSAIEDLLGDLAVEPAELDLYRVEETWWASAIRYGTGIVKFPWEYLTEKSYVYVGGGTSEQGKKTYDTSGEIVRRDGPHPEVVPLNQFGIDPRYSNMEDSDFVYQILNKDRYKLDELKEFPEIFDPEALDKIIPQPDRQQPDLFRLELQGSGRKGFEFFNECSYEWDIYECWFRYRKDGQVFSLIGYYHLFTDTLLGCIYNPYPDNDRAFEDAKLAYDDQTYYGYGFCEMLESYQRELSDTRNWKLDNKRFATTGVGRINKNSKLSSMVQLFPGAFIMADQGEVEPLQFGAGALNLDTSDEMFIESATRARSGIDPATGGSGGGIVNQKRGIYSAGGTAIAMQAQNNRNNLRMSDCRSSHVRLGRKVTKQYAYFGLGKKLRKYGDRAKIIARALENYKDGKLGLIIKPVTASLNRELEKQNDILLATTLERLYAGDAQIIQALSMQGLPPALTDYYVEVLRAKNRLYMTIMRNFGHDDAASLIPVPAFLKEQRNATINGNGVSNSINQPNQAQIGAGGAIPITSGQTFGGVPTGTTE